MENEILTMIIEIGHFALVLALFRSGSAGHDSSCWRSYRKGCLDGTLCPGSAGPVFSTWAVICRPELCLHHLRFFLAHRGQQLPFP